MTKTLGDLPSASCFYSATQTVHTELRKDHLKQKQLLLVMPTVNIKPYTTCSEVMILSEQHNIAFNQVALWNDPTAKQTKLL